MNIKAISLNLWLGGVLLDDAIQFLADHDADLVLLQEVYNGVDPALDQRFRSIQMLKERLGYPHQDFVADFLDNVHAGGKAQRGNAILSKFPITKRDHVFLYGEYTENYQDIPGHFHDCPRHLQRAVLDTPVGELNVFNIHGVWDMDGDNFSHERRRMSELVIEAVKNLPGVILAGDTNAKPTNLAAVNIKRHLKSVFISDPTSTFNMKQKTNPGYATSAVDMMLTSHDISVLSADCPSVDISDHLPLVAELSLSGGARDESVGGPV